MDEAIYEELIVDPTCSPDISLSVSTRHSSSMDSGVCIQDQSDTSRRGSHNSKKSRDKDNKRSKVRFSDDTLNHPRESSYSMDSGDYVIMNGSVPRAASGDSTESEQQYVEMTPPKQWSPGFCGKDEGTPNSSTSILKGKAIVRLSVYVNSGMLTVHLMNARHLQTISGELCNAYIKVSLAPRDRQWPECYTDIIHDTDHPVFEEKFSFELLDGDLHKRLFISAWNAFGRQSEPEFLGGMSFGVQHIHSQKRTVDGWYYLLHEHIARRKHVQAVGRKHTKTHQTGAKYVNVRHTANPDTKATPPCIKSSLRTGKLDRSVRFKEPLQTSTPRTTPIRSPGQHRGKKGTRNKVKSPTSDSRSKPDNSLNVDGFTEEFQKLGCSQDLAGPKEESCARLPMTPSNVITDVIRQCVTHALTALQSPGVAGARNHSTRKPIINNSSECEHCGRNTVHSVGTVPIDPLSGNHSADDNNNTLVKHNMGESPVQESTREDFRVSPNNTTQTFTPEASNPCRLVSLNYVAPDPDIFAVIRPSHDTSQSQKYVPVYPRFQEQTYVNVDFVRFGPAKPCNNSLCRGLSSDNEKEHCNGVNYANIHSGPKRTLEGTKCPSHQPRKRRKVQHSDDSARPQHGVAPERVRGVAHYFNKQSWGKRFRRVLKTRGASRDNPGTTSILSQNHFTNRSQVDVSHTKKTGLMDKIKGFKFVIPYAGFLRLRKQ